MPRVLTIPDQTSHSWNINNKGELFGDLWFTKNIDLESNLGKVRLAERAYILYNEADSGGKWNTFRQTARAFVRSDADGNDRWWAMVGDMNYDGGGSPFWNTGGTDPTNPIGTWQQDAIVLPPSHAVDSMEVFLKNTVPATTITVNISSSTFATPIQVTLSNAGGDPGIPNGATVVISGHTTNTAANGTWTVYKVSTYVFTLVNSIGNGVGGASGTMTATLTPASVGNDRLISSDGAGDLSMLNTGNIQSFQVSSVTNASPIVVTLVTNQNNLTDSGIGTGNQVTISGVGGTTAANGTWTVTRLSPWVFVLNGSVGNSNYTSGGTAATSAWKTKWWTGNLGQPALNTSYPTVVRFFKQAGLLIVTNGNYVHTIDANLNVAYKRFIFPEGYYVNCIVDAPDYAWFFLNSTKNKPALASRWDGGSEDPETPISCYDYIVHSATQIDGIPYCLNGKGQLLKLNGQAFQELDVLPCFVSKLRWGDGYNILNDTVCHRNSMTVVDGLIHVLLKSVMNNDVNNRTTLEDFSSGIWCYDPTNGFYCKYSIGNYRATDGEWGDKILLSVGALTETTIDRGRFLASASFYPSDLSSAADSAIFASKTASTSLQRGQIVTSQLHVPSFASMYVQQAVTRACWKFVSYSFERFMESSDYVIMKMRTSKSATRTYNGQYTITWTSTSTFTCNPGTVPSVGDEVEIVTGPGAGGTFHIKSIVGNVYTLDEAVPNASGTSSVYFNNWTKVSSINGSNMGIQEKVVNLMRNSSWIQLKVELRGTSTSPELQDMVLGFEPISR